MLVGIAVSCFVCVVCAMGFLYVRPYAYPFANTMQALAHFTVAAVYVSRLLEVANGCVWGACVCAIGVCVRVCMVCEYVCVQVRT